jgi:hypothetical protein
MFNLTSTRNEFFHDLDVWSYEDRATTYGPHHYLDHPKIDLDRKPNIGDSGYARKLDISPDDEPPRTTIFQVNCLERKDHFLRWVQFHHNV